MPWITEADGEVVITVHACPRANRNALQGLHGDALKVRLQSPPIDGKANEALLGFLAATLGIARRDIRLISGATGRHKRVAVRGTPASRVRAALHPQAMPAQIHPNTRKALA